MRADPCTSLELCRCGLEIKEQSTEGEKGLKLLEKHMYRLRFMQQEMYCFMIVLCDRKMQTLDLPQLLMLNLTCSLRLINELVLSRALDYQSYSTERTRYNLFICGRKSAG